MQAIRSNVRSAGWQIAAVLALALGLRLWGLTFGLPYISHPDEPTYLAIVQRMVRESDLNPQFFNYPSLFFYLNALAQAIAVMLGILPGGSALGDPQVLTMAVGYSSLPATFVIGRLVSVLFGTATVGVTYLLARQVDPRPPLAVLAALLVALSPTAVAHSRFITPDTFTAFFALLAALASVSVWRTGTLRSYLLAGAAVGLTAATKYNGALVALVVVAAHLLRCGPRGLIDYRIYLAGIVSGVAFLAATPFALLDVAAFLADVRYEAAHYAQAGHPGMEGAAWRWYPAFLWSIEGPVALLAAIQIGRAIWTRGAPLLLSAFPLGYLAFIATFDVRNDRTALPVLAFLAVLAAGLLIDLLGREPAPERPRLLVTASALALLAALAWPLIQQTPLRAHFFPPIDSATSQPWPWLGLALTAPLLAGAALLGRHGGRAALIRTLALGLLLATLALPLSVTALSSVRLTTPDSRATARAWLETTLPPGSRVAVESYGPYVDPHRFVVRPLLRLSNEPPDWYREQQITYVVFSEGMYGRFYSQPTRYRRQVALYNDLFESFQLVQAFADGDLDVRVYRVGP